jgi:hypothetical protein
MDYKESNIDMKVNANSGKLVLSICCRLILNRNTSTWVWEGSIKYFIYLVLSIKFKKYILVIYIFEFLNRNLFGVDLMK